MTLPVNFQATALISGGPLRALPGAVVTVYAAGTTSKATIYADANNTPLSNPIIADSNGNVLFFVVDGLYDIIAVSGAYLAQEFSVAVGPGGTGGVPTSRQVTAAGLAVGGGSLASDRVITVPAATAADVAAGTSTTLAVTPASLGSTSANAGYVAGTWSGTNGLQSRVPTLGGTRGQVYGDSGTHTDPVVGGSVPNSGIYAWSTSPAGWQWINPGPTQPSAFTGTTSADGLTYTASTTVAVPLQIGNVFSFVAPVANTGPVKLNGAPILDRAGQPLVTGNIAAGTRYILLPDGASYIAPGLDAALTAYPSIDVVSLDAQAGFVDPDGRALLVVTPFGTYFEAFHPAALDALTLDMYPGLGRSQGFFAPIPGASNSRRLNANIIAFNALVESPDDWQVAGGRGGYGTGKRAMLPYRTLANSTLSPATVMRCGDNPPAVQGLFITGNSNSHGVTGQVARAITTTPPPAAKYQVFGFNAYPLFPNPGGNTRGVGGSILKPEQYVDIASAFEGTQPNTALGETHLTAMGAAGAVWNDQMQRAAVTYFVYTWGCAGQELGTVLSTSTAAMWSNGVAALKRAIAILALYGRWLQVYEHEYIGGHQDRSVGTIKSTADAGAGTTTVSVDNGSGGAPTAYIGQLVTGHASIPAGSYLTAVAALSPYTVTLSNALTATLPSGTTLTLQKNVPLYKANLTALWQGFQSIWVPLLKAQIDTFRGNNIGSAHNDNIQLLIPQLEPSCSPNPTPADGASGGSEISLAQADWVRANMDKGRISHPRYIFIHGDDTPLPTASVPNPAPVAQRNSEHLAAIGTAFEGEYLQKARLLEAQYRAGTRAYPQAPLGLWFTVSRSGATVTFAFFQDQALSVPYPNLSFDTTTLAASAMQSCEAVPDGNFGFTYSTATITAPPVIGTSAAAAALGQVNDQVTFTISSAVAGVASYAYRGPGSTKHASAWGNLCWKDTSLTSLVLPGVPLFEWCLMIQGTV